MPLTINCLIKDTELADDLRNAVKFFAFEKRGKGDHAGVREVFNEIRKAGIEVDLESVGAAYLDIADHSDPKFNTVDEVYKAVGENEKKSIDNMVKLQKTGEKQIGELSADKAAVRAVQNFFTSNLSVDNTTKSLQKTYQEALLGYMRKITGKFPDKPKTDEGWRSIIYKALGLEEDAIKDVNGVARNVKDMFQGMKDYLHEVTDKIKSEVDPATAELWDQHINDLQNSTYQLLLNSKDGKQVLNEIMQEAGFTKKVGEDQILDWKKLAGSINDISILKDNVLNVLKKNGFDDATAEAISKSLQKEYKDLQADVIKKATGELNRKQGQIENPPSHEATSDYERLAGLAALGVFDGAYDKLLFKTMGVSDLDAQSIADLKSITEKFSQLNKDVGGQNVFALSAFRTLQEEVNHLVAKNVNNKSFLAAAVHRYAQAVDLMNIGKLMGWATMAENVLSGSLAVAESAVRSHHTGAGMAQDLAVSVQHWMDVMTTGQTYGKEHFKFGVSGDIMGSMRLGIDTSSPGKFAKSVASSTGYLATALFRATQSGGDTFFKSYKTQKLFLLNIHAALEQHGGMTKQKAAEFINKSMYGQSFEDAKVQAKGLLEKYGMEASHARVVKLANDMVKENLTSNGALTPDTIEAAFNSAYKVAGIGLGHETNNYFSRRLKEMRAGAKQSEETLLKEGDYNGYARKKLFNTVMYHQIFPFAVGAMNWMQLRAEKNLGVGFFTGIADYAKTKTITDFSDKRSLEKQFTDMQVARERIARSAIGLAETGALVAAYMGIKSMIDKDEDNVIVNYIKNNFILNKLFQKVATDPALVYYYWNKDASKARAAYDYFVSTTNFGSDYDIRVQVYKAEELYRQGKTDEANGVIGNIIGGKYEVPTWRAYKGYGRAGQQLLHWNEKLPSNWQRPTNFFEGLIGGGMLEDVGVFERNSTIEALPGIGPKSADKFHELGYDKMRDLKGEWWNSKDANGHYIIRSEKEREKAKSAHGQWMELNK